ncbi:MAG: hypothetical protein M3P26_16465 [Gemmatimonadota bacterium]|nr:hypothetical protein [Gemmatimonadota bacterium]
MSATEKPSVPRLSEDLERLMEAVASAGVEWGECEDDGLLDRTLELAIDDAKDALRQRISEMLNEARKVGVEMGKGFAIAIAGHPYGTCLNCGNPLPPPSAAGHMCPTLHLNTNV